MKLHIPKWTLLALSFPLLILWYATGWLYLHASAYNGVHSCQFDAGRGAVMVRYSAHSGGTATGWAWQKRWGRAMGDPFAGWTWLPGVAESPMNPFTRALVIPLWMPLVLCAGPAAWLVWRDRKAARLANLCPKCSYPLGGLPPGSPCPECGKGTAP